jgi:hypothetical protein
MRPTGSMRTQTVCRNCGCHIESGSMLCGACETAIYSKLSVEECDAITRGGDF